MKNCITFNTLTTGPSTLLQILHLLKSALGICRNCHWTSSLRRMLQLMGILILTRLESSLSKFRLYINKFKNINLIKIKENRKRGIENIDLITSFKREMRYGCTLANKGCKGKVKISNPFSMVHSRS